MRGVRTTAIAWAVAATLPLLVPTATSVAETRLTLAHGAPVRSVAHGLLLKPWAQRLAIASGGRLEVSIETADSDNQPPRRLFERLQRGEVDLVWGPIAAWPEAFAAASVFELPFLAWPAEATSQAAQAFHRRHGDDPKSGLKALLFHTDAPHWLHSSRAPIRSLEDLKGLRVQASTPSLAALLESLGAEAVRRDGPDGLAADLAGGGLDAALLSFAAAGPAGIAEHLRYHTRIDRPPDGDRTRRTGLGTAVFVLAMNRARFDALDAEMQSLLVQSADRKLAETTGRTWDSVDRLHRREATADGQVFVQLSRAEHDRWRRAARPVIEAWLAAAAKRGLDGPALLREARALIAKYYVLMAEENEGRTRPPRGQGG